MKKLLKFILTVTILLSTIFCFSQQEESYDVVTYINWTQCGSDYWTEYKTYWVYNSFDWAVSRSVNQYNGYYIYDVWFYSQSYILNHDKSYEFISTNVSGLRVYSNGTLVSKSLNPVGITFYDATPATTLRFYDKSKYPTIIITWDKMKGL